MSIQPFERLLAILPKFKKVILLSFARILTLSHILNPITTNGSLVSVKCDQPPLICFGVCRCKAITKSLSA
jgi:hypothetical protein